jgi:hypothetical protein
MYQPQLRTAEKQVKFANSEGEGGVDGNGQPVMTEVPVPPPTRAQRLRAMTRLHTTMNGHGNGNGIMMQEAGESLRPAPRIVHQPSKQTMSSASEYSTASGEERQIRAPSNLLLAALGMGRTGSTEGSRHSQNMDDSGSGRNRWSWSSNLGIFTRHSRQQGRTAYRTSQATEHSATTDGSGRVVVMGVAL